MIDTRSIRKFISLGAVLAAAGLSACGEGEAPATIVATETPPAQEAPAAPDAAKQLAELTQRHAEEILRVSPELATALGVGEDLAGAGYLARLGDYGFDASQRAREMNETFLQELRAIDSDALSGDDLTTYNILTDAYRIAARRNLFHFGGSSELGAGRVNSGDAWAATPYFVTQLTGPHLYLPRMLQTQHPIKTRADIEAYIARLDAFGRVFDETIETIRSDAAQGVVPPDFVLAGAVNAIVGLTAPAPAAHPLVTTLKERMSALGDLTPEEQGQYAATAAERVETVVYPAYERLSAVLESLKEQSGAEPGVWRIGEAGEQYYQFALDAYGGGGMNGDEIHDLGLAEVARITTEMDALLKTIGLEKGSVAGRMKALAGRKDNLYPNTDEGRTALLDRLRGYVADVNAKAPNWFNVLPPYKVEVRRIPVYEQDSSPGGYYSGPSLDGTRPGIYWINLKNTADNPIHSLKTLTYHEAVPGHHFQISAQRAAENMPLIRNMLSYSEFAEGWALYAEALAKEMGMYENDPEGDLGRLQAELFRAARLVVDSGLHAKQWTREQAIDYMTSVTGETRDSVTREVERYAAVPGQACAYKLGMLKIQALRAEAEAELGDRFDLKGFHDVVLLTGSAPLGVLEKRIDRWVEEKKA